MDKMKSSAPLDYAVFKLSPKRSRCQLFVSSGSCTEKLASGSIKPFIAHLKVMEEQVASAAESVKLEAGQCQNAEAWFTKGTLERFLRFVYTPEVLEMANSSDVEMSQLEAACRMYTKEAGDQLSGGAGSGATVADDATKKELLRAIDLRLATIQQDLSTACAHAAAGGFNIDTVSDLQMFAHLFGSHRLYEACGKFISLCERRPTLISEGKTVPSGNVIQSPCESDISYDDNSPSLPSCQESPLTLKQPSPPPVTLPFHHTLSRTSSVEKDDGNKQNNTSVEKNRKDEDLTPDQAMSAQKSQPARRLSVQDRINLFENKHKESSGEKPAVRKSVELRRLSSDVSKMATTAEKVVMSRWNGASHMSIDLSHDKDGENPLCTPSSTMVSQESEVLNLNDDAARIPLVRPETKIIPRLSRESESRWKEGSSSPSGHESTELKFNLLPDRVNGLNYHISDQVSDGNQSGPIISMVGKQDNSGEKLMAGNQGGSEKLKSFRNGNKESAIAFENRGKLKDSQKAKVQPDASCLNRSSKAPFSGKVTAEALEGFDTVSMPLSEQRQRVKQPNGNQELNNQLKMKANKLEKLFAEHTLRVPGDESKSAENGKTDDAQFSPESDLHFSKPVPDISLILLDDYNSADFARNSKNKIEFDSAYLMKATDSQNYGDSLVKSFSELSVSEGSRGKLYKTYIEKREAKLREDWSFSRAEKEAKLKFMQDSLEKNKYEMEAKLLESADGLDSVSSARRRIERLRSYNSRSIMKMEQLSLDLEGEDGDETLDFLEKNHCQDRAFENKFSGGGTSKGAKGKKHYRTLSSSETHTIAAPLPRSATMMSNSGKRRMQPENLLTNSVPNLSDLRKENSKPSVGRSKTTYSQVRSYVRSKSAIEDAAIMKDKSHRLQATGKSSTNPREFREMSLPDSNGVDLTPLKFNEGVQTSVGTKPFLKKGSRAIKRVSEPGNDGVDEF